MGVVESGAAGLEAPERQPVGPEGRKTGAGIQKKQTRGQVRPLKAKVRASS